MGRMVAAVIVSNLAAPCLLVLYVLLITIITDSSRLTGSDWLQVLIAFAVFLPMSWAGMSVTVFPVSLLFAWLGWQAGWRSAWIYILAGASISALFNVVIPPLVFGSGGQSLGGFILYACLGGICGWIYWHIAIKINSKNFAAKAA